MSDTTYELCGNPECRHDQCKYQPWVDMYVFMWERGMPLKWRAAVPGGVFNFTSDKELMHLTMADPDVKLQVYECGRGWIRFFPEAPYPSRNIGPIIIRNQAIKDENLPGVVALIHIAHKYNDISFPIPDEYKDIPVYSDSDDEEDRNGNGDGEQSYDSIMDA